MENKKILKERIGYLNNLADLITPLQSSLRLLSDSTDNNDLKQKINVEISKIQKKKTSITKDIQSETEKLSDINKNLDLNSFTLPVFGEVNTPTAENLIAFCNHFSGHDEENFAEFFSKLRTYSEFAKLSEKGFKMTLSGLLKSEAFELFNDNRDKSVHEIIRILSERFTNKTSILSYDFQLKNFKRNWSVNLSTTMNKVDTLIKKTSSLVPPNHRESRRHFLLMEMLLKVIDSKTRAKIRSQQIDYTREGISLSYDEMLQLALYSEMDHHDESQKQFLANSILADSAEYSITETLPSAETFLATPVDHDTYYDIDLEDSHPPREDYYSPRDDCYSPRDDCYSPRDECYSPREDFPAPWDDSGRPTPTPLPIHQSYYSEYEDGVDFQTRPPCHRCQTWHDYKNCPAYGILCLVCFKQNHYSSCCFGVKKQDNSSYEIEKKLPPISEASSNYKEKLMLEKLVEAAISE